MFKTTDMLPAGLTFVFANASEGQYDEPSGIWSIGLLASGQIEVLQLSAIADATGEIINSAEVTAADGIDPDSTPNNNNPDEDDQDTAVIIVQAPAADLELLKEADNLETAVGARW